MFHTLFHTMFHVKHFEKMKNWNFWLNKATINLESLLFAWLSQKMALSVSHFVSHNVSRETF